jgi:hypothetical protein
MFGKLDLAMMALVIWSVATASTICSNLERRIAQNGDGKNFQLEGAAVEVGAEGEVAVCRANRADWPCWGLSALWPALFRPHLPLIATGVRVDLVKDGGDISASL